MDQATKQVATEVIATDGPEPVREFLAFPLTSGQAAMWHADRSWPGCSLFNASFRWSLSGPLDTAVLERSFNEIVCRHEVLRATFAEGERGPVQFVAPYLDLKIAVQDLRTLPQSQRDEEMDHICTEEAKKSFDLVSGPLIRVGLLRMEDERHVLTLTLHHIVIDGWSVSLIMEELQAIYGAYVHGKQSPLPELAVQFGDYVVWHNQSMASPEIRQQLEHWKRKLTGYRRLDVPADFPRTTERQISSKIISQMLPHELTDALKKFSDRMGGTIFTTALTGCMMLLRRYTGETDISVASPLAGRNRAEIEGLVGLFFNNLTLRTTAAGDPMFEDFATSVRDTVWDAFANQDVPFEDIVHEVRPQSDPLRDPFLSINFVCQREYARASTFVHKFDNVSVSTMPSKSMGALYDLNFFMVEREAGWRLSLDYNTSLYKEATAQQMLAHFRELLEGIAENPKRRLSEFKLPEGNALPRRPLHSDVSRFSHEGSHRDSQEVPLAAMSSAQADQENRVSEIYAIPASPAQERFWLLAKLAPTNPAFNMASCVRLAGRLGPDTLQTSLQLLVDRHETLRTTFEEMNGELTQIVVGARKFSLEISNLEGLPDAERGDRLKQLIREEAVAPFDLISGPLFRARLFRLSAGDHALVTTIHHILADGWSGGVIQRELWSTYEALSQGNQPSLEPLAIQYGDYVAWQREWLSSAEAQDHLDYWSKQLTAPLPVADFPLDRVLTNQPASRGALETLLLPEDLTRALKSLAQSENVTMFTLTLSCFGALLSQYSEQHDLLIGSPILNRKPETESLIGPFAGPIALRLNFSGNPSLRELLRRVGDGVLDALNHSDLPFEKVLETLPANSGGRNPVFQFYFSYQTAFLQPRQLRDLTVAPMPKFSMGVPFEMQLAFIERHEGVRAELEYNPDLFDASTIEHALQHYQTLLRAIVTQPDIPFAELPRPKLRRPIRIPEVSLAHKNPAASGTEIVAPADEMERELGSIWKDVLRRDSVGVTQSFFALGGYSLLAAKLLLKIEKRFSKKLSLAALFEAPTIRQQAELLHRGESKTFGGRVLPIQTTGTKPPLFCVDGGPFFLPLAQNLGPDQPVYGLRLEDTTQFPSPYRFEDIAAYHIESLRMARPKGPYYLGGWCLAGVMAYEMARQLQAQGEEVFMVALFDAANPAYLRRFSKAEVAIRRSLFWLQKSKLHFHRLRRLGPRAAWEYLGERVESIRQNFRLARLRHNYRSRVGKTEELSGELRGANAVVYLAARSYKPGPYSGPVALFRSALEPLTLHRDPMLGWKDVATRIVAEEVPGDHREIFDEPAVRVLAAQLGAYLSGETAAFLSHSCTESQAELDEDTRTVANPISRRIPQGTP